MKTKELIKKLFTEHHSVEQIMKHVGTELTVSQVENYLYRQFKRTRRIPRLWEPHEDKLLTTNFKLATKQLIPLLVDRNAHEIAERRIQLKLYAWLWPNQNRHITDLVVYACYLHHHCFSRTEIEDKTGIKASKYISAFKTLSEYVPEFKKRRPRHKYGRLLRQREFVNPLC